MSRHGKRLRRIAAWTREPFIQIDVDRESAEPWLYWDYRLGNDDIRVEVKLVTPYDGMDCAPWLYVDGDPFICAGDTLSDEMMPQAMAEERYGAMTRAILMIIPYRGS